MTFLDWTAVILGVTLIFSGVRAIRHRQTDAPERYAGDSAVRLGWLWIILGALFVCAVTFDISFLKGLFRLFLEAAN